MTVPLLMAMPGNDKLAERLAAALGWELGRVDVRQFPDGETYLRLATSPAGRAVAPVCTLDRPNDKLLSLLFAAATARELRASEVGLVSPYLAYMRQDRRFKPGEATSRQVAHLLSGVFNWLVTAVHGLFAEGADKLLAQARARVVTSNSVPHATNDIDLTPLLAEATGQVASP